MEQTFNEKKEEQKRIRNWNKYYLWRNVNYNDPVMYGPGGLPYPETN